MEVEIVGVSAALLMGLAGSTHCFGMCGGIAGALGMRVRSLEAHSSAAYAHTTLYQLGRITGYAMLGTIAGAVGQVVQSLLDLARVGVALRIASGALLLLIAARMLLSWNGLAILERYGARVWRLLQPLTRRISGSSARHSFMLGMLWGFLPCGMVYSMLAFAATSGSALAGAALMLVFGTGTVPAMFGGTLVATSSAKAFGSPWAKCATGILIATFGMWMIAAPFLQPVHGAHVH